MTEHDIHTLTGAYAADALPGDERREFDEHLEQCPACRQEVAELAATTARLGAAVSSPAPEAMRARVLAEVARTRQLSPVVSSLHRRPTSPPWFRQPLGIAASFLLVLAVGLGIFAGVEARRADRADERADLIAAIITDPHRAQATADISSGGSGILVVAGHRAIFEARGVKSLPGDRTYQLWIIGSKGVRSVGVLGTAGSGDIRQFVDGVKETDQIGLTVEPDGGSDKPTTKPVMVLPVPA
jgi:anti-sigma-K factor RskA